MYGKLLIFVTLSLAIFLQINRSSCTLFDGVEDHVKQMAHGEGCTDGNHGDMLTMLGQIRNLTEHVWRATMSMKVSEKSKIGEPHHCDCAHQGGQGGLFERLRAHLRTSFRIKDKSKNE
ncbi:hypothetical protein ANTRET_LOCUS7427 [Anthophora retusa]